MQNKKPSQPLALCQNFQEKLPASTDVQRGHQNTKNNFRFITEDCSKHLKCPLCSRLMIKPSRLHPCGHTFCFSCIDFVDKLVTDKQKHKKCPFDICSREYKTVQIDRTAESLIDELKVQCTNQGCVWKGCYEDYKKVHQQSCVLKNGLGSWLSQLTKGVNIKPRTSEERLSIDELAQNEKNILQFQRKQLKDIKQIQVQKSQKQIHVRDDDANFEKDAQGDKYMRQNLKCQKQQEADTKSSVLQRAYFADQTVKNKFSFFEFKQNIAQNQRKSYKQQREKRGQEKIQEKQKEKKQEKKQEQIHKTTVQVQRAPPQSQNKCIRPTRSSNRHLFSIPFGPSISEQMTQSERKAQNTRKKELKKLQGWS